MKKYLLGLFAVVLAVGFSAFTFAPRLVDQQFELTEGTNPTVESNYFIPGSAPTCSGTDEICTVLAPEKVILGVPQGYPDLSVSRTVGGTTQSIQAWISDALSNDTPNDIATLEP